jgi:site-specific DNA-methyltransferase (adenine-specific)
MKKYNIILADPPWSYQDQGCQGTMANHYKGMSIKDICDLPIPEIAAKDCILFLWATYPMLKEALMVMEKWGFTYKTIAFQWLKLNPKSKTPFFGLGRWTRGNTEPCLLATKGKPKRKSKAVFQLIQEPRMKHSKKPEIVRGKIIELVGDLPRIELFARQKVEGWDCLGLDVDGIDIREGLKRIAKEEL